MFKWNIAVIARNESASIERCLRAIEADAKEPCAVSVVVNGSADATEEKARRFAASSALPISIYSIPFGDKANAINQFIYWLRSPDADAACFVDGYAAIVPGSLSALEKAIQGGAIAATGVPASGRTAESFIAQIKAKGGMHGSLHALRTEFCDEMVRRGIRIPIGTYRVDGLIAAMVVSYFVPGTWDISRIAVVETAKFQPPRTSVFRQNNPMRHLNRRIQQARGRIQNAAFRDIVKRRGYEGLSGSADEIALRHLKTTARLMLDPFTLAAVRRMKHFVVPHTYTATRC